MDTTRAKRIGQIAQERLGGRGVIPIPKEASKRSLPIPIPKDASLGIGIRDREGNKVPFNRDRDNLSRIENIANCLVEIFRSPDRKEWFYKIAWHLPENYIWETVEKSTANWVNSPRRYFSKACKNELARRGF